MASKTSREAANPTALGTGEKDAQHISMRVVRIIDAGQGGKVPKQKKAIKPSLLQKKKENTMRKTLAGLN